MKNDEKIFITKEEAFSIAKIQDNQIHCFLNSMPNMLVGADHSKESFLKDLDTAKEIEVGGDNCRRMGHALVLWQGNTPYFFEHNEDKLKELLKEKGVKDEK